MAAWVAAALTLALPATAAAHQPRSAPASAELDHALLDTKLWRSQARAHERWRKLTRAERRRALRRQRRATSRAFVRAQAAADDPSDGGSWAPPFVTATDYSAYAVHAAMLPTGKVLMWGPQGDARDFRKTYAWVWDPAQGYGADAFREVTPTDANGDPIRIFCSGQSFLADGRLLVVGGTFRAGADYPDDEYNNLAGLNAAVIFDPVTETWSELARPEGAIGRWYPSQVLLPDGRTLIASGYTEEPPGGVLTDVHEIYDAESNTFTMLDGAQQRRALGVYPHLVTMPDGKVLTAGPEAGDSALFDPAAVSSPWTDLPPLSTRRWLGNAVLLPEGAAGSTQLAQIGGTVDPYNSSVVASNEAIDLDDPTPAWASFPALNTPRWSSNTILLPDRSMVVIGGDDQLDNSPPPERAVELYDPVTESWQVGPSQVVERGYHSTALLLPDGRVLSTGDNRKSDEPGEQGPNETAEIYSPPYLFNGPRPVITSAPATVDWDVPFAVGATGDIDEAVLIAPAAVTHATDMTQRLVPLATVAEGPEGVTLQSPPTPAVAPPGAYMLFLLDDGVPSVARWVTLKDPPPAERPETGSGPSRTPDAPSGTPADFASPVLGLEFAERRWLRRLRRRGHLRVEVTVDEPAAVDLRLRRRTRRVAHAAVAMEPGELTVRLRLRRPALRWIRKADAPRLRFVVEAIDAADNDTVWKRLLRR